MSHYLFRIRNLLLLYLLVSAFLLLKSLGLSHIHRLPAWTSHSKVGALRMQHSNTESQSWMPTRSQRNLNPTVLCESGCPRMAKDVDFANTVIDAWDNEVLERSRTVTSETRQLTYQDESYGKTLYSHVVRRRQEGGAERKSVPGILAFHTGAGPHDVFLMWKADSLVCNEELFPNGCVVFVVDILSDDIGWAWDADRSKFNAAREEVLDTVDDKNERPVLQSRIRAAIRAFQNVAPEVDTNRIGALGWCLGGYSILELGRMRLEGIQAMVTFHGVFGEVPKPTGDPRDGLTSKVLICNGELDPFVNQETNLKHAIGTLKQNGHDVRLMNLEGAKHGFTNPAQDFNPNEAFAFNEEAARKSWCETLALLKESLC